MAIERSAGFFAREVLKRFSHLPIEDELRLNNARIRDHFLTSIFTLAAFREVEMTRDREALARFHAANKFLLMACHQQLMHEMGQWVANRAKTGSGNVVCSLPARCSVLHSPTFPAIPIISMSSSMLFGHFQQSC